MTYSMEDPYDIWNVWKHFDKGIPWENIPGDKEDLLARTSHHYLTVPSGSTRSSTSRLGYRRFPSPKKENEESTHNVLLWKSNNYEPFWHPGLRS